MRNPKRVILKWAIFFIDKKTYNILKRPGNCLGKKCKHNCCKKMLGLFRCPYLNKESLCSLELKGRKPFTCVNSPTILDDMPKTCGYMRRTK